MHNQGTKSASGGRTAPPKWRSGPASGAGFPIVDRDDFSDTTFRLEIDHPVMARAAQPGQFVIVVMHDHAERIPLTIADYDRDKGTVTLVIQAVGKSTREMQRLCHPGVALYGMVGPMGRPSHVGEAKTVIRVGGGLGVAPIFPQARAFKQLGAYVIGILGFRSRDLIFWEDKFRACCDELTPITRMPHGSSARRLVSCMWPSRRGTAIGILHPAAARGTEPAVGDGPQGPYSGGRPDVPGDARNRRD